MTRSKTLRLSLTLVLAVISYGLIIVNAQSPDPTGLADVTVSGALRQEFSVIPGATTHGSITLRNRGEHSALVSITPADMGFSPEGQIVFEPSGSLPASNAGWIEIAGQVEVGAGSSVEVPFTLNVPEGANLQGSYWSLLQVQPLEPSLIRDESEDARVRTNVNVIFQYSVTVLSHVGTPDRNVVQFTEPGFGPKNDNYQLAVTLRNPGAFVVQAETWLELYDSAGGLVRRVDGPTARVYPGAVERVDFDLGDLEREIYQAVVIADAGGNSVFGARYNLDATAP